MIEKVRSKNGEFLSETKTQFIWDGSHSTGVYAGQSHYHIFVVNQNPNNCQCFWDIGPKKIWGHQYFGVLVPTWIDLNGSKRPPNYPH